MAVKQSPVSKGASVEGIPLTLVEETLDILLKPGLVNDYCPNGLQVQGAPSIRKIVSGVTASQAFLDAAVAANADAVLVHHGYFWRGEDPRVVGMKKKRLHTLLANDVSLFAYHLPLDVHAELGNNVQLAKLLGIAITGDVYRQNNAPLVLCGELEQALPATEFAGKVSAALDREPLLIEAGPAEIKTIAWCTGAAQNHIDHAVGARVDAYLTGEASEQTIHSARENGLHFIAAGHHATERYGVQAVGAALQEQLGIEHQFIDVDNPV